MDAGPRNPSGTISTGSPYSTTFVASGSPAPTYLVDPSLPPGLILDSVTGVLQGTPTRLGTYHFVMIAHNKIATSSFMYVTMTVIPGVRPIPPRL